MTVRIVIVSGFYSRGMGYTENCLSKALAQLGHEVHVVTSIYNVYGSEPGYDANYRAFLGPPQVPAGTSQIDGYAVHRLEAALVSGYIRMRGLGATVAALAPDVVHSIEIASLQTFELAALKLRSRFRLFSGTSQTMSVMKPYMKNGAASPVDLARRAVYRLTRTVPSFLASLAVDKVYAVTPDGIEVAVRFYGVPRDKVQLKSLGTDTDTFHPPASEPELRERAALRERLGVGPDDILCVYTGRFSRDKDPLVLASAIEQLRVVDPRFRALFIGDGVQRPKIAEIPGTAIVPFMTHETLAQHYRAADIAVWPKQESLSMLDAAASALPLVVSDRMGEPERVRGNGLVYAEGDAASLAQSLRTLADPTERRRYGDAGRTKMLAQFSWNGIARSVEADFFAALARR